MRFSSRGQATVELLMILSVLFVILGFALQSYTTNQSIVNEKKSALDAQRNASILRTALESASFSPIGSTLRVFIPPASQDQNIQVLNGVVEVRTSTLAITLPTLVRDVNAGLFHDGNIVILTRTQSGVSFT